MKNQWYNKKWVAISLHVLFWATFSIIPFILRPDMDNRGGRNRQVLNAGFSYLIILNIVLRVLLFYANAYFLIPRFIYRKKYGSYVLALAAALGMLLVFDRLFFILFLNGASHKIWTFFVFNLLPFFFIVISSTAFRLIRDKIREEHLNKERETENLKTELSFLRSQVSPHFMFNVLNNMVALARKQSDALEPSLIKLSSLLRYMLYETDEDKVLVEKEIEYLNNYIDLQKQRFGKNILINASFDKIENGHTIEPMLLIPFVENAFKHGSGLITNASIEILLKVQNGNLSFSVKNRYSDQVQETRDKTSGIGLNNVRRRLNLLYGKNHSLEIVKKDGWFTVMLQLNLH